MTETTVTPLIELSDEFINAYQERVEELIADRKANGALLSTFDVIAGASLIYFLTGNNNKMPAAWMFAALRPGTLPEGALEELQTLHNQLAELRTALQNAEEWLEDLAEMETAANQITSRLRLLNSQAKKWANP